MLGYMFGQLVLQEIKQHSHSLLVARESVTG
jgi:hypothetical protein